MSARVATPRTPSRPSSARKPASKTTPRSSDAKPPKDTVSDLTPRSDMEKILKEQIENLKAQLDNEQKKNQALTETIAKLEAQNAETKTSNGEEAPPPNENDLKTEKRQRIYLESLEAANERLEQALKSSELQVMALEKQKRKAQMDLAEQEEVNKEAVQIGTETLEENAKLQMELEALADDYQRELTTPRGTVIVQEKVVTQLKVIEVHNNYDDEDSSGDDEETYKRVHTARALAAQAEAKEAAAAATES